MDAPTAGDHRLVDPGLAGRVALVTGANHGIGAATAEALAAHGAAVMATYLRFDPNEHVDNPGIPPSYDAARASTADDLVGRIRRRHGRVASVEADLADRRAPRLLFDRAEEEFGPVEILVNNASGWRADTFLPDRTLRFGHAQRVVDADSHDRQFAVDSRAAALLIAEFTRRHLEREADWGRIVGLTSGGRDGFPEEVSYGAAKAAQESYTLSAAELGSYGVTANMVHPPITDTGWITPAVAEAAASTAPLGHVAQPADVAEVIIYLASHQARFVTGQLIRMS